jgi:hypothetical protein
MLFRFDDVCANTDMEKLNAMAELVGKISDVQYSVSMLSTDMSAYSDKHREFTFLPIWKAYSDHRRFYGVDMFGIPDMPSGVILSSHGLIHVDHRQMHREAQELSILVSCSILRSDVFVPPFNKWNHDTESVCKENDIHLQKFEDGWLGAEHNQFNISHQLWYTHSFNWTVERFKEWLGDSIK